MFRSPARICPTCIHPSMFKSPARICPTCIHPTPQLLKDQEHYPTPRRVPPPSYTKPTGHAVPAQLEPGVVPFHPRFKHGPVMEWVMLCRPTGLEATPRHSPVSITQAVSCRRPIVSGWSKAWICFLFLFFLLYFYF
jgi:hypothetical protein